jgi:hypothetical protein
VLVLRVFVAGAMHSYLIGGWLAELYDECPVDEGSLHPCFFRVEG